LSGLGLALVEVRLIDLSPGMILLIFLPPILFEAAWKMKWPDLQREIVPSSFFAMGSVPITIRGGLGHAPLDAGVLDHGPADGSLPGRHRLGLGAGGISGSGPGKRLTTLLEGESLFNDGAAVVAFSVLLEQAVDPQPIDLATTCCNLWWSASLAWG
jgi:CPA1 family monovalent cation:H+ antiporter